MDKKIERVSFPVEIYKMYSKTEEDFQNKKNINIINIGQIKLEIILK